MKPLDPRALDIIRFTALAVGVVIAIFAFVQYVHAGARPDAAEMRDLWLVVAIEVAAVPIAFTFLLPRRDARADLAASPLKRGTSIPNPWAY